MDANALNGLDINWDTLDGFTPLAAVIVMEALDEDGELVLLHVADRGLKSWKALGMVMTVEGDLRISLSNQVGDD